MACLAALSYESTLGGCFILSGYLTLREKLPTLLTEGGRKTPIFQAHGLQDGMIPFAFGQLSSQVLRMMGLGLDFKQYPMGHESCAQEIQDLRAWLAVRIPDGGAAPAAAAAPIPADLEALSVKELKELLASRHVDISDCFEKSDLLRKARSLL